MTEQLKHAKVRTFTKLEDGSTIVETKSYHEELNMYRKEHIINILTSNATLLADVISCLDVLKGKGTSELVISIKADKDNLPKMITKTYVIENHSYGGRQK